MNVMRHKPTLFLVCAVLLLNACLSKEPAPNGPAAPATKGNNPANAKPPAAAADQALITAAGKGDNAKINELLGGGANVNAQNDAGGTALMEAVYNNHPETVKLLLEKGADPDLRKKDGATALGFAQKYPPIMEILKAKGAKVVSNLALDIELMAAANKGDLAKVKDLVDKGAYPNYHNEGGSTPLIEAVYGGHAEVVKYLLEKGADPNARKNDGAAALGFAKKYPPIAEMLKAAGARE
jgi:ankyrin repeat protein